MDFFSHLLAIVGILLGVLLPSLWRLRNNRHSKKGKLPPEAAGALPFIGHLHLLGGPKVFARTLGKMADKYGPIFTLQLGTHRAVVISNDEKMKECFTTNDKSFASRPKSTQAKLLGYNYAAFGFAPYSPYWRDLRKLITVELLSSHRIKSLRHVQVSEVSTLVKDLYLQCKGNEEQGPSKIVISEWLDYLTFNIITRIVAGKRCFGVTNDDGTGAEGKPIGQMLREFMYVNGVLVPSDLIPFLGWIDFKGTVKSIKRLAKELDAVFGKWIEEHKLKRLKGDIDDNQDFIDVMLSKVEDGSTHGHPRENIIKATNIILGGSETTSVTLTWILSNLLNNRRALELAQEELDLRVGRGRCVEDSDIENLVYLQAIIKETLRLYPAGPVSVPHEAMEDCYVSGYHIPKGTRLLPNIWKLHRDPKVWSNPDDFIPERFLTSHANVNVHGQNFEYIPFGTGRRSCPGLNFAMQVLPLALARLLQAFSFTTPLNQPVDMTEGLGITLPKATPLEVLLTPRLAPQLY